jgi:drug/metabolite transporter (DMT)-like permease
MAVAGALTIAFSAILVKQAGVSPSTAAIFRCAYAVPVLGVLAWWEDRRLGPRSRRDRAVAALAGVFFSADLICWHHAIEDVGAGLATVLGNLQVLFVALTAWLLFRERPHRGFLIALPVVMAGVVLVSGLADGTATGSHPLAGIVYGIGTSLAYAGFLIVLRRTSSGTRHVAGPLAEATAGAAAGALLFGLTPALRLAGGTIAPGQRAAGGARSTRRLRDALVVTEYALAIVLLAGAGLLVRSLASVLRVDPGFHAGGVLTVEMHSPAGNDPLDPPRFEELVESLEALPGVEAAGGISRYFQSNTMRDEIAIAGMPPLDSSRGGLVNYDVIAGHYLQALGIPLLRGRYFSMQDGPNATRVAIVNNAFARAFLEDENPIGKVFRRGRGIVRA